MRPSFLRTHRLDRSLADFRTAYSDLFDAYNLIKQYLGQALAYVFAVALLAAGQSASLTVTLSGQIVSEG